MATIVVTVRLEIDAVDELDELAENQAMAASRAAGLEIVASRSRTVRDLINLGLTVMREREQAKRAQAVSACA